MVRRIAARHLHHNQGRIRGVTIPESSGEEWKDEVPFWGVPSGEPWTQDEKARLARAFYWGQYMKVECDCCTALMGEFSDRFRKTVDAPA